MNTGTMRICTGRSWAWSETYRDGAQGKERIVVESAMARPLASTEQDDFVGRMIWALSDPSGLPGETSSRSLIRFPHSNGWSR